MAGNQITLPDLGEGLTEATLVAWRVAVGDAVAVDQVVAEVETAKATVELPAPHAGVVVELHAAEGDEIKVGAPLLALDSDAATDAPDDGSAARPTGDGAPADDGMPADDGGEEERDGDVLVGYGTGAGGRRRRRRGSGRAASTPPAAHATRPRAKPPVRKLAKDLGVDLEQVGGTGPDGRVTRDDIRAAAAAGSTAEGRSTPSGDRAAGPSREVVTGVRARIADHVATAWREIPAASCWVEVDATALLELRDELVADLPDVRITPLAVVLRCCAVALRRVPALNASFDADAREIVHHDQVHLGVATQTDRGLLVPVVRDAGALAIPDLARRIEDLAGRARADALAPTELRGSTFTVSNFGAFGIDGGGPIINHPEAGILGVGRIAERPWVVDGQVAVRQVVQLSLTFDHRVCDGAEAAGFLRLVADLLERPTRLLAH
jgi:pyruvate dehydrogenase E2 component (dihydrolipoamide acetyltransferase)